MLKSMRISDPLVVRRSAIVDIPWRIDEVIILQSGTYDLEFIEAHAPITRPDRLLAARSTVSPNRRFQARPYINAGATGAPIRANPTKCGPFRWTHVVRTPQGLAFGTIYRQHGDDLTDAEVNELRSNPHIELRETDESRGTAGHV